jgi:hypothetical protein
MSSQCSLIVNPLQKSKKRRCNNAYKLANSHAKANNPGPKENNSQSALCVFIFVDFTFRLRNIQHKRQTNNNLVNNRSITFSKRQKESSTSAVFRSKKAQKKKSKESSNHSTFSLCFPFTTPPPQLWKMQFAASRRHQLLDAVIWGLLFVGWPLVCLHWSGTSPQSLLSFE